LLGITEHLGEILQLSPQPLHGMGLKQGYSHSTLPKK